MGCIGEGVYFLTKLLFPRPLLQGLRAGTPFKKALWVSFRLSSDTSGTRLTRARTLRAPGKHVGADSASMMMVMCLRVFQREYSSRTTTTMGSEKCQNSVKGELPLAARTLQPKKACRFALRRRTIGVGVLIGVLMWVAHKQHTSAPEPWLEDRFDLLGYDKSGPLSGKRAEELFL